MALTRSRLFLVLAALVLSPLVAAWIVVGVALPARGVIGAPSVLGWVLALFAAATIVVLLRALADRLSELLLAPAGTLLERLSQRLELSEAEADQRGRALTETMSQVGHALAHTHDSEGLLRACAEAAHAGATARTGVAVLYLGDTQRLTERVTMVPDGSAAQIPRILDQLAALAARAAVRGEPCPGDLGPGTGGALAVPMRRDDTVVGVLAVATRRGPVPAPRSLCELADATARALGNVQEHRDIQRLSITDALTGVGNLRHLLSTLSREVERAHRFGRTLSVLMLDLDHFKEVNDWGGHAFGDVVLREFAARLRGCVREVDLVARRGGEEFALVLPETPSEGAQAVMRRILEQVRAEPFRDGRLSRTVTVSIGIASYPEHGRRAEELLAAADAALYAAKRAGRDRGCVAPHPSYTSDLRVEASVSSA